MAMRNLLTKVTRGERIVGKKAVIVIHLVGESIEESNEEIEKEISEELSKGMPKIPWFKKVEKVTVSET